MSQCFSRIYGCVPCVGWAWCQERSDKGIGCPGTGVVDGCSHLCGHWELNSGSLQDALFP